eukprot:CAMPEP_0198729116 /NCGR_PEP_ID=MMETSP1475-20131203/14886_1 /TAXON_ID= ORGANISM="Unidentified sp., Strain CCMP1999" /NCGR_SAMPLE_ID=MMETSP1475 /ASSEMBLY_ACC=CAM_ASM_001111 /LENGTH=252 /DNA_ID=CAMNT_0044491685 /DNA_START=42 /DNA_END=800 /DNA_ORIENTATION=-
MAPSSNASIKRMEEGPKFNQIVTHGGIVYLSGQIPTDTSDQSIGGQTLQVLNRIDSLLKTAGTEKSHLLSVSVWLKDINDFAAFNDAWDKWLDTENKPTRAVVEAKLAKSEWLVEVAATAAMPSKAGVIQTDKAAAAVGPYNQAIRLEDGLIFVSGCIGLLPESGNMVGDSLEEQTAQVLSNMKEILAAGGASPNDIVKTTILLVDIADFAKVNDIYKDFFDNGRVPARATFAVKDLPKGAKIEIECVAVAQ